MQINYNEILKKNMINVFKDVLLNIETNGLQENHHLYITFNTQNSKVKIPIWLKEKYTMEMTIVIQYEYWNFKIKKNSFNIGLSFNDIKTDLEIPFDSVISFADPYANFGLRLIQNTKKEKIEKSKSKTMTKRKVTKKIEENILEFKNFRKN